MTPFSIAWALLKAGFMPMPLYGDEEEDPTPSHLITPPHYLSIQKPVGERFVPEQGKKSGPGGFDDFSPAREAASKKTSRPDELRHVRSPTGVLNPTRPHRIPTEGLVGPQSQWHQTTPYGQGGTDISDDPLPPSDTTPITNKRKREFGLDLPITERQSEDSAARFNQEMASQGGPTEKREPVTMEQALDPNYNPAAQVRELGLEGPKGATGPAMQQKLENMALRTSNDTVSVIMQILKGA